MKNLTVLIQIICLSLLGGLTSCGKDEFTEPASVNLNMEMVGEEVNMRAGETGSFVKIVKAQYHFSEIEFEGYRPNGHHYFFSREFENGLSVIVEEGKPSSVLDFDMPQGVYDRVNITLKVHKSKAEAAAVTVPENNTTAETIPYDLNAGIIMEGYYTNSKNVEIPLVFVFDFDEALEHKAGSGNGSGQVSVSKASQNVALIQFNPTYWMQLINSKMLQGAKLVLVKGVPTIVLSEEYNQHIFNLLTSRIRNASELKFL